MISKVVVEWVAAKKYFEGLTADMKFYVGTINLCGPVDRQ